MSIRPRYVDKQAVIDLAKTLTGVDVIEFLEEFGDPDYFLEAMEKHQQRPGQAFFNSLDFVWQDLLSGTPEDPFYSDREYSVALAVSWLTAQQLASKKEANE